MTVTWRFTRGFIALPSAPLTNGSHASRVRVARFSSGRSRHGQTDSTVVSRRPVRQWQSLSANLPGGLAPFRNARFYREARDWWREKWREKEKGPVQTCMEPHHLAETVRFELTDGSPRRQFSRLLV